MKPLEIVLSVLITICLGLCSFQLKWTFDTNARLSVMAEKLERIANNTEIDTKQNKTIIKHWTLHGWAKDEINRLRYKEGMEPIGWPPLGND